jgi:hypothetical protein
VDDEPIKMINTLAGLLMNSDAEALCDAGYGDRDMA